MNLNVASSVKWIRRGVAKGNPDKVELDDDELRRIVEGEDDSDDERAEDKGEAAADEFNLKNYDEEDDALKVSVKNMACFDRPSSKSPNKKGGANSDSSSVTNKKRSDSDSDQSDERIESDDNLLLVCQIENEKNSLEVYVYNHDSGDFYIHHDVLLDHPPFAVEWLNVNGDNFCAVATMKSVIQVWDLDIMETLEPAFCLGRKKKTSPEKNHGHTTTVVDLAWNEHFSHILASCSADKTALLWDLDSGQVSTILDEFRDTPQSIMWKPTHASTLLTGCADRTVRLYDCRLYGEYKTWKLKSEVETVYWAERSKYLFFAGTSAGRLYILDERMNAPLGKFKAHTGRLTGMGAHRMENKFLYTCGQDGFVNIWDMESSPKLLSRKNMKMNELHCLSVNPNVPEVVCVGGTVKKGRRVKVVDSTPELTKYKDLLESQKDEFDEEVEFEIKPAEERLKDGYFTVGCLEDDEPNGENDKNE